MKFSIQEYRRMEVITTNPCLAVPQEVEIINFCDLLWEIIDPILAPELMKALDDSKPKIVLDRLTKKQVLDEVNAQCGKLFNTYKEIGDFYSDFHFCHTIQYAYNLLYEIKKTGNQRQSEDGGSILNPIIAVALFPSNVPELKEVSKECAYYIAAGLDSLFQEKYYDYGRSRSHVDITAEECSKIYSPELEVKFDNKKSQSRIAIEKPRYDRLKPHIENVLANAAKPNLSPSGEALRYFEKYRAELVKLGVNRPGSFKNLTLNYQKNRDSNQARNARRSTKPSEELKATKELKAMIEQLNKVTNCDREYKFSPGKPRLTRFPNFVMSYSFLSAEAIKKILLSSL